MFRAAFGLSIIVSRANEPSFERVFFPPKMRIFSEQNKTFETGLALTRQTNDEWTGYPRPPNSSNNRPDNRDMRQRKVCLEMCPVKRDIDHRAVCFIAFARSFRCISCTLLRLTRSRAESRRVFECGGEIAIPKLRSFPYDFFLAVSQSHRPKK